MAKKVILGTVVTLSAVNYQAQIRDAALESVADEVDTTNMASAGFKEYLLGLISYQLTLDFIKDSDLSGLDAVLRAAHFNRTLVAWTAKLDSGAISTSNPEFQGNILINKYTPIHGRVGQEYAASYTYRGTGAIVVDVTP